ncbi:Crp/Fnr family transcriptional regulator [Neptunitalea lumnitzerae]|uniref:cAMP-binding protein n=1 Tax=Neptunitalea lumnitzerae TaxID=2965509 RepID=A0ABQ5MNG4_9FLAO|nr:Crp/Fnr family transcriptional regulator [Neptunitalea sp. Y10]GLB50517.1 cAMP-binding protein [Neptunitalea sp. Y10]
MDGFQVLLESLSNYIDLTDREKALIVSRLRYEKVKKKEILLRTGAVATQKMFMLNGILRQYIVNDEGIEHTSIFAVKGWWFSDIDSFVNEAPAKFCIETMVDSEIIFLSKQDLDDLYLRIPKLNVFFRELYQRAVSAKDERILNMLCSKAEERYEQFLRRYPNLEGKIPQYHIASYLGVTPEFFSRMKSQRSKTVL